MALSGMVFCMTGTLTETRAKITTFIEKNGGQVKGSITNQVNYLLATENEVASNTGKVGDAIAKQVPIVSEDFMRECVKKKKILPHDKYLLYKTKKTAAKSQKVAKTEPPKKKLKTTKNTTKKTTKTKSVTASWSWKGDSGWVDYDTKVSKKIEENYLKWVQSGKKKNGEHSVDKERFIEFSSMLQRRFDDPSKRREVKRTSDNAEDSEEEEEEEEEEKEEMTVESLVEKLKENNMMRNCLIPRINIGEGDVMKSKCGGMPYFKARDEWPMCPNCEVHMNFFFQIEMSTIPAKFQKLYGIDSGLLQFFVCLYSGDCGWNSFDKGSLVRVVEVDGPSKHIPIPETEEQVEPKQIVGWREKKDLPMHEDAGDLVEYEEVEEILDDYHEEYPKSGDKMGGWPVWIQGSAFPECEKCGTTMTLVFQVESEQMCSFMWGDSGNCHIFQCPKHKTIFTSVASCG